MRATYSFRWDRGFLLSRSWLARFLDAACSVYLFNVFPTKLAGGASLVSIARGLDPTPPRMRIHSLREYKSACSLD